MGQPYVRILIFLGMAAVMCGMVGAAGMGIIAETHETSGAYAPACTAPCECISESTAIQRWGENGYDKCTKTVCGQSADAMVQYYCIHPVAGAVSAATTAPAQATVTGTSLPPAPVAAGTTQKSPSASVIVLAAVGTAMLAASGMRRK